MHLALTLNPFEDTDLLYAQQLGVSRIVGDVSAWDLDTLAAARNRVRQAGLVLVSLASLPAPLLSTALQVRQGGEAAPEADAAIEKLRRIISDAGKVGIPVVGYGWPHADIDSLVGTIPARGEAVGVVHTLKPGAPDNRWQRVREEMWQVLGHFLESAVPAAEDAGVRLAFRTDLAVAALREDRRILDSVAELDRLQETAGGRNHGLDLDHGFVTQVLTVEAGMKPADVIRHFGRSGAISAVRMRNLRRSEKGAEEHFLDEDKEATLAALEAYREAGFDGPLCPIAAPAMTDDTAWRHKGIAFAVGYLRAMLQAIG